MNIRTTTFALLTLVMSFYHSETEAQQDPQFSMNMATRLYVNPAYAGMNDAICFYSLGRQQWVGHEGRPETYLFGAHGTFTIPGINLRSGGGLSIMGDGLAQMHFTGIKAAYSAHIPLSFIGGEPGHLGVGVAAGMLQYSVGNNWRSFVPYWQDPTIPDPGYSVAAMDLDVGLYYRTKDVFFGISSTHMNAANYNGEGNEFLTEFGPDVAVAWNSTFNMVRHYYLMGGYDFELPSYNLLVLKPSVFVKTELSSAQFDLNLIAEWNNMFWGGMTYRYNDAAVLLAGFNQALGLGTLRGGYAYDITTSRMASGSSGSHEVFLQYCLKLKSQPPVQKHKTVRFL